MTIWVHQETGETKNQFESPGNEWVRQRAYRKHEDHLSSVKGYEDVDEDSCQPSHDSEQ